MDNKNNVMRMGGKDTHSKLRGISVDDSGKLLVSDKNLGRNMPSGKLSNYAMDPVLYLTQDGTAYCGANTLKKTTDFTTFETIHTFPRMIDYAFKLDTGSLFVVLVNGDIWQSDNEEENFVLITDALGGQGHETNTSRASVYHNIVLVGEYIAPRAEGPLGNKIYISTDYGENFKISELPAQSTRIDHIHSVIYDPYEQLIWAATGDTPQAKRVFWSKDFGTSWETHDVMPFRMTTVMPLEDCVIFGLDDPRMLATYKYTRIKGGPTRENFTPILDYKIVEDTESGTFGWTSQPSIVRNDGSYAFFGTMVSQYLNDGSLAKVGAYATDGVRYIALWEFDGSLTNKPPYGIRSVHGPDIHGRVVVTWKNNDKVLGSTWHALVFG